MIYKYNRNNFNYAKELRNNMTKHEKRLWYDFLKKLPVTVKRQKPIGNYIVDFFIPSANLVIELDGAQHDMPQSQDADCHRDEHLKELGITVLRYKNSDIDTNFSVVCNDVLARLGLSAADLN